MVVDSLDDLKAAFDEWRSKKRHAREAMPGVLLERARRAVATHGQPSVVRATKVARKHLRVHSSAARASAKSVPAEVPPFSRIALSAPVAVSQPLAEVETPTGMKLRVFLATAETLGLLSALCAGGAA